MSHPSLNLRVRLVVVTLALVTPHAVFPQATSGTVIGTVLDPSRAVVPNATVTVADTARGVNFKTTTNESGNYTQSQLTPGNYSVSAERAGFQKVTQENVEVNVGQSARVDLTMPVGTAGQEVTVSEAPPGVITDSAQLQTTLTARQIDQLPVLNRNFTNLTLLTPGATLNTFQHAPSENPQQSTLVNTNGQEFAGSNYLLDGMNNNDAVLGIVMVNPPIGSVGEFTTVTSNYDAEYTQAGGAVILVQTKSGSNEYHGNAFEFLQNNIFQARDSFTQGLYAARHNATRYVTTQANALGGGGVVGMTIDSEAEDVEVALGNDQERTDMIFTFHCIGTAIVELAGTAAIPAITPTVNLS